jgi:hypothetical protein
VRLLTGAKYWITSAVWAVLISILSTDSFSSEHTSGFIIPALRWIFPHASMDTLEVMHAVIRKSAHLTEYFILSIFLFLAQRGKDQGWKLRWPSGPLLCAQGTPHSTNSTNRLSPAERPPRGMRSSTQQARALVSLSFGFGAGREKL